MENSTPDKEIQEAVIAALEELATQEEHRNKSVPTPHKS